MRRHFNLNAAALSILRQNPSHFPWWDNAMRTSICYTRQLRSLICFLLPTLSNCNYQIFQLCFVLHLWCSLFRLSGVYQEYQVFFKCIVFIIKCRIYLSCISRFYQMYRVSIFSVLSFYRVYRVNLSSVHRTFIKFIENQWIPIIYIYPQL